MYYIVTLSRRIFTGTRDVLVTDIVQYVSRMVGEAIAARGQCLLAVPGGSVADAVLPPLSRALLPWDRVHLFWCDERAVPVSHRDSNAGQAMRLVAGSSLATVAHLHPMSGDGPDLLAAADMYAVELNTVAGSPPVLDLVLLGVGDDGHVASLFPGHAALEEQHRAVVVERHAPKAPTTRLSLSLPVLLRARDIMIVAFGANKADALHHALEDSRATTPVARVIRHASRVRIMLDDAAAGRLTYTKPEHLA